jgi:hypothetical protein
VTQRKAGQKLSGEFGRKMIQRVNSSRSINTDDYRFKLNGRSGALTHVDYEMSADDSRDETRRVENSDHRARLCRLISFALALLFPSEVCA